MVGRVGPGSRSSGNSPGQALAVFDALDEFRSRPSRSRWCAFLGSAAEYADPPEEISQAVAKDTSTLRDRLRQFAEPVVGDHSPALTEPLLLIISGDLAMRLRIRTTGRPLPARLQKL